MISAYGPFTSIPASIMSTTFAAMLDEPYSRYAYSTGMDKYTNPALVSERALKRSLTYPAKTPPTTPPMSNSVLSSPAFAALRYTPPISVRSM